MRPTVHWNSHAPADVDYARERFCEMLFAGVDFETAWAWRLDFMARRRIYVCRRCGPQFADKYHFQFLGTRSEYARCRKCMLDSARVAAAASRAKRKSVTVV